MVVIAGAGLTLAVKQTERVPDNFNLFEEKEDTTAQASPLAVFWEKFGFHRTRLAGLSHTFSTRGHWISSKVDQLTRGSPLKRSLSTFGASLQREI